MREPDSPTKVRTPEFVEQSISVDAALATILAAFRPLPAVSMPLLDALDLVLAEDVIADVDVPPFRNSAMDGYAVRAADTKSATLTGPIELVVVGEVAAGKPASARVEHGTAIRIMTGAPIPDGADAVVRFEDTDEAIRHHSAFRLRGPTVKIHRPAETSEHVRLAGEDVRHGERVLKAGKQIRPVEVGLLASLNRATIAVHRPPRVAILSTGDELVEVGPDLQPGQIRNSNGSMLAAMVRRYGGEPLPLGAARDSVDDLHDKLIAARSADLIVTSGGVSAGDYDIVKDVLSASGAIAVWQVRMKPGKPLAFGRIDNTPLLGLPGNPVAAAVSFAQFCRPAILTMLGCQDVTMPTIEATLTERIDNRGGRRHFVRGCVFGDVHDGYMVRPDAHQGSGMLSALTRSNGLIVIPEEVEVADTGRTVTVQMVDWDRG